MGALLAPDDVHEDWKETMQELEDLWKTPPYSSARHRS